MIMRDRRRDDRPEDRHRRRQRRRVLGAVAVACCIIRIMIAPGPAASASAEPLIPEKNVIVEDVGVAEAAAKAADELRREAQQHLGQRAAGHELGGQDEERHRHQREHVDAAEEVLGQRDQRQAADERSPRASRRRARRRPARRARAARCSRRTASRSQLARRRRRTRRRPGTAGRRTYGAAISSRWTISSAKPIGIARYTAPIGIRSTGVVWPQVSVA